MSLHYSDANGGCGLPGVEEIAGRKRGKLAERIGGKRFSLSKGLVKCKGKMVISECQNMVKMIPSEQARQNEEVGFGITSFGVVGKKI